MVSEIIAIYAIVEDLLKATGHSISIFRRLSRVYCLEKTLFLWHQSSIAQHY